MGNPRFAKVVAEASSQPHAFVALHVPCHADDQGPGIQSNEQHDEVCKSLATELSIRTWSWFEQLNKLELLFVWSITLR